MNHTPVNLSLAESDYLRTIAQRLTDAGHGKQGAIISATAQHLSISEQEVYRRLKKVGYVVTRKQRSDKGTRTVDMEAARLAAAIIMVSNRDNSKKRMSVKLARTILVADGKVPNVSATTLSRAMRDHHCHPEQIATPSAWTAQRSLHPNHVWQIDASICVLFYLKDKTGLQIMDRSVFYKNKPHNFDKIKNDRVIRYVVTDHYSGSLYVEYVLGSEDTSNLAQCFLNAIQKRGTQNPMHGVPHILYMDKGSANTSGMFTNLLSNLKIDWTVHAAGNPRATGSVEKSQDIVETNLELRLRFQPVDSIEELNAFAQKWLTMFNHTAIHTRTKTTRNNIWQRIQPSQLRIAPPLDVCQELISSVPVEVAVKGDLTVNFRAKGYDLQAYQLRHIDGIYPKAKVSISVNPYRIPDIDVTFHDVAGNPTVYTVSPVAMDDIGKFPLDANVIHSGVITSQRDSPVDIAKKAMLQAAYGKDTTTETNKAHKSKATAFVGQFNVSADVDSVTVPDYIPRAGAVLDTIASKRELTPLSIFDAAKSIKGLLASEGWDGWTAKHYQALQASYPSGLVPAEMIETIATAIKHNNAPPTTQLKVVGG